ncbi:MAG TPA: tRNA (adenosine(37)-N6)-dimethylallyltransferase MiaA, partial [Bacillota bacterium]|nr:tRNA (adenosine(37)-N6)-dimethylallyltransferase MiaA [Bacillota bacterium]
MGAARTAAVIVGPTAAGKSAVALNLAVIADGEVISADSMQVYRGMDIGTAKPSEAERKLVRHHLLDVCDPDDPMTVSRYCELARAAYDDIVSRGRLPIIAGGTGLYVDAATMGFLFPDAGADEGLRDRLYRRAELEGPERLHAELSEVDGEAAGRIHPNDARRIVRALEVFLRTGRPISELQRKDRQGNGIPSAYFGVSAGRRALVSRIGSRVDRMMEMGLLDEVRRLVAAGYGDSKVAMQAIGYKELIAHIRGEASLED